MKIHILGFDNETRQGIIDGLHACFPRFRDLHPASKPNLAARGSTADIESANVIITNELDIAFAYHKTHAIIFMDSNSVQNRNRSIGAVESTLASGFFTYWPFVPINDKHFLCLINHIHIANELIKLRAEVGQIRKIEKESSEQVALDGRLIVNRDEMSMTIDNHKYRFTGMEFELLWYLAKNAGKAQTRENLMKDVWKKSNALDEKTINVHVRFIRRKLLPEHRNLNIIDTVRGLGYMMPK